MEVLGDLMAAAGVAATSVWAAYQNWDDQSNAKKAAMILLPIIMLGILLAVVG